jgi:hypothetical protein
VINAKSAKLREKRLAHNSYIRFYGMGLAACNVMFWQVAQIATHILAWTRSP